MKHVWKRLAVQLILGVGSCPLLPGAGAQALHDLVITEIMPDPDPPVGLPNREYCEIYNRGSQSVNLAGWTFYDGNERALPSLLIHPGTYVIICDDGDTSLFGVFGYCAPISSLSLTNSGEKISLRDPMGNPVDSVTYSNGWFGNALKKDGGWSLEKVDVNYLCPVSANWKPSEHTSGGTPGSVNSVNGVVTDNTPPVLLRAWCPDSSSVVLQFNEPLDPANALQPASYAISPGNITTVTFTDAHLESVTLTLDANIPPGITGTVTVSNITDCPGNPIESGSQVKFGLADSFAYRDLVINEILFNPLPEGYDFVELFHAGNGIIDLSRVNLDSYDLVTGLPEASERISDLPWLIFPGDYLVLTENPDAVASQYRTSFPRNFLTLSDLPSMNADEGHIGLSHEGIVLDAVHYFEDYHFELLNDHKGISLEKINPAFPSHDPGTWHSASQTSGFATPGLINSQYSDVSVTEEPVGVIPEIFSPDNDGYDDIITFMIKPGAPGHLSNIRIYNYNGQVVFSLEKNTLLGTASVFNWDGIGDSGSRVPVGIYVAVIEVFNLDGAVKNYRLPFVVATKL